MRRTRDLATPHPGRRLGLGSQALRRRLEALSRLYDRRFLDTDPLGMVRRFHRAEDRELVGLLAAALAYGRVETIRASLESLLRILGPRPSRFLEAYEPLRDARRLDSFRHRFTRGRDVALLLALVRRARERAGSLGAFFREGDPDPASASLEAAMNAFGRRLFALDARPFHPDGRVPRRDGARWLLPVPSNGSVCKRHCLYLRWMIRPDDGLDCGVWTRLSAARLVVPLDVHVQRVAWVMGWTRLRSPSWSMALEVTAAMRVLEPRDPTQYDFALSRLGILGRLGRPGGRLRLRDLAHVLDEAGQGREAVRKAG